MVNKTTNFEKIIFYKISNLGEAGSKTTEIHTHITTIGMEKKNTKKGLFNKLCQSE